MSAKTDQIIRESLSKGDLTYDELRLLNSYIVMRLRNQANVRQFEAKSQFKILDKVQFRDRRGNVISGTIVNMGRGKSVGVQTEEGIRWKVSPTLLTKV